MAREQKRRYARGVYGKMGAYLQGRELRQRPLRLCCAVHSTAELLAEPVQLGPQRRLRVSPLCCNGRLPCLLSVKGQARRSQCPMCDYSTVKQPERKIATSEAIHRRINLQAANRQENRRVHQRSDQFLADQRRRTQRNGSQRM